MEFSADDVARALHRLFIGDAAASLRKEDRQKVAELVPLLAEVARAVGQRQRGTLVDLCAGKSALGLLAAALVLPRGADAAWRVVVVERDPDRIAAARAAAARLADDDVAPAARAPAEVVVVAADVAAASLPTATSASPVVVVALHACGAASDAIVDVCVRDRPTTLLLVPCCYGAHPRATDATHPIPGQRAAGGFVDVLPRHGLVGRRLAQAVIDAERTLRLEAGGYAVDVVEFVAATVTPHNLLWRARRVDEPPRRARAAATRALLLDGPRAAGCGDPAPPGRRR
jgi:hypothetical protein